MLFTDHDGVRFNFVLDDSLAYRYYSEQKAAELDALRAAVAARSVEETAVARPRLPRQRTPLPDTVDR
ncbi:MAG: hypothetical protein JWN08_187 [Frankiales bacterium]|nr:hypothetical protein [Frankiales bacterium]